MISVALIQQLDTAMRECVLRIRALKRELNQLLDVTATSAARY